MTLSWRYYCVWAWLNQLNGLSELGLGFPWGGAGGRLLLLGNCFGLWSSKLLQILPLWWPPWWTSDLLRQSAQLHKPIPYVSRELYLLFIIYLSIYIYHPSIMLIIPTDPLSLPEPWLIHLYRQPHKHIIPLNQPNTFRTQCPFTLIPKSAHDHSHPTWHKKEFNGRVVGVESLNHLGLEYLTLAHLVFKNTTVWKHG